MVNSWPVFVRWGVDVGPTVGRMSHTGVTPSQIPPPPPSCIGGPAWGSGQKGVVVSFYHDPTDIRIHRAPTNKVSVLA